jgi:hypothetical protein
MTVILPCGREVRDNEGCADKCPWSGIRNDDLKSPYNAIERCYRWHKNGRPGPDPVADLRVK